MEEKETQEQNKKIVSYWKVFALIDGKAYRQTGWIDGHMEGGNCIYCGNFEFDKDSEITYCDCKHTKCERIMFGEPSPYVPANELEKEWWLYPVQPRSIIVSGFYGRITSKLHPLRRFWYWLINKHILSFKLSMGEKIMGPWKLRYRDLNQDMSFTSIMAHPIEIPNVSIFKIHAENRMPSNIDIMYSVNGAAIT